MVSMAEWHKVIKLQAGAPVLFDGVRGVVRRANPVRATYAIHLPSEQRTVDVPFGSEALWADVGGGEPVCCGQAVRATSGAASRVTRSPRLSYAYPVSSPSSGGGREIFSSSRLMMM